MKSFRFICILLGGVLCCANAQKTNVPPLERQVTLNVTNMPVDEFLRQLSEEGNFSFSYSPKMVNTSKKVSIDCKNKSVRYVLNLIFAGNLSYKNKGNHVILTGALERKPIEQKTPKYFQVSGYVIDRSTSARLSEVSIYDQKTLYSTISDDFGYFTIQLPYNSADIVLRIEKMGYKDSTIVITQRTYQSIEVAIDPDLPVELVVNVPQEQDSTPKVDSTQEKVTTVMFEEGDTMLKPSVMPASNLWLVINKKLRAHMRNISDTLFRAAQFSVLPALSSNKLISGNVVNDYSFNLLIGYAKGVRILEMGVLANIDGGHVGKCQMAGLFNMVGGKVSGFQAAGLMNIVKDTLRGVQMGGLMNLNSKHTHGCQIAGLANHTHSLKGVQIAGLYNMSLEVYGSQFAGLFNKAVHVKGTQTAGLFNCADHVEGSQIALINIAKKVEGVQIGFLNISDTCSGIPIGFLTIVKNGYHTIEVSTDEVMRYNLALRMGVRKFYNIFGLSSSLMEHTQFAWAYTYGVGTSVRLASKLYLDLDLQSSQLNASTYADHLSLNNRINISLDWQFAQKLSLAFGPSFDTYVVDSRLYDENAFYKNVGKGYPSYTASTAGSFIDVKSWIGWKAALRFL